MSKKEMLTSMLHKARSAAEKLAVADTDTKNSALQILADTLRERRNEIINVNAKDVKLAREAGQSDALIDRLTLTPKSIESMASGLEKIIDLPDPVGEIHEMNTLPNGLRVARMRMPLGVIGIIYESRPNVAVDASALCLKSGNAVLLRGGSEAAHSNCLLGHIIAEAIEQSGLPPAAAQVLEDTDRELVKHLLRARGLVDLVIPRGGEKLIQFVDENATVPIILHYKGVCHVFVDKDADLTKAAPIVLNSKVQRPGVCNALETLLVHADIAPKFLPAMAKELLEKGVELRGCEKTKKFLPDLKAASEADWDAEYLDLILAVRVVEDLDGALEHIARYGSGHTESIITENYTNAGRFLREAAASCVMVNASTRFNDGGELGLGAEIGISTTKLHAFGPMGLRELTTSKFIVMGSGQIRK